MSGMVTDADEMLRVRGVTHDCAEFVTALAFDRAGGTLAAGLGDGRIVLRGVSGGDFAEHACHDGAVLALVPDIEERGFCSGGDDGALKRLDPATGESTELASFGMKWVEHVLTVPDRKAPLRAAAVGKTIHLLDAGGATLRTLVHPSTVAGMALDPKHRRLAAAHYNGASLWFVRSENAKPQVFEWKGSHLAVALHPDIEAMVTAMQENELHGWKLPDGQHMRMSGYPTKPESLDFTRSGKWLATAGAEAIVIWPFFGGGPMGKAPLELAAGDTVVRRVACHPQHEVVAAGFADGSVVVADIARERILPVAAAGRGAVSALGWSPNGAHLAFGTETGFVALIDFSRKD
ncbi:MAG TPA: WD40 repeat domain-containing protein [Acidiphilium sp.]|uniref:WD40 repeat domain-containing protein n=1 Tax=unclassified Acidiphilium TaxID=2617493 RepID=UPI000BC5DAD2|nr:MULTISPECIES: WD40 repeat domain-containing protein [unclassified Acidiphilium]OYV57435.1 MAG: hypothetical protein B7Z76_01280 [Acidiphilium sp. 20-67-58]HQT59700.1 WD40 repeat domain-containing protein [Acidiphilium sp.]HQU11640.1 WD40 repeat domain-containing protein [Acidiphilium sp.]